MPLKIDNTEMFTIKVDNTPMTKVYIDDVLVYELRVGNFDTKLVNYVPVYTAIPQDCSVNYDQCFVELRGSKVFVGIQGSFSCGRSYNNADPAEMLTFQWELHNIPKVTSDLNLGSATAYHTDIAGNNGKSNSCSLIAKPIRSYLIIGGNISTPHYWGYKCHGNFSATGSYTW